MRTSAKLFPGKSRKLLRLYFYNNKGGRSDRPAAFKTRIDFSKEQLFNLQCIFGRNEQKTCECKGGLNEYS